MDERSHDELIAEFDNVTGVGPDRSKFYLESSNWELQTALSTYFEGGNTDEAGPVPRPQAPMDEDDSSSEEEGQAFYAGGSTNSGQQVIGPSKKKRDLVSKIFKSAKEHGAESIEVQDISMRGKKKSLNFKGKGYRLGETEDDHQVVAGAAEGTSEEPQEIVLRMWSTGYTLDDGPLQSYDDPANKAFLRSVMKGQIPRELMKNVTAGSVYISMEDRKDEDYVPPKKNVKAFTGKGHSLGSPSPSVLSPVDAPPAPPPAADKPIQVKEDEPVTQVQIRFPDSTRKVLKLNHTHTVGDIRSYVTTVAPGLCASHSMALMTTFPHAELTDDGASITQSQLLNATIVVKLNPK